MKILTMPQHSPEWWDAKLGLPSASNFHKIITPKGSTSSQAGPYLAELALERLKGRREETYQSEDMAQGKLTEPEARRWFEFDENVDVEEVGFVLHDSEKYGSSPDGLIGRPEGTPTDWIYHRGLEIKCPKESTQIYYILTNELPAKYIPQVQGSMLVTGFEAWWFVSYHRKWPKVKVLVERDDKYIAKLKVALDDFTAELDRVTEELR